MIRFLKFFLGLLLVCGTVFFHEYGHYSVLKMHDVKVLEVTVGFGPTIWSTKFDDGTTFAVKPILLGGYTKPLDHGPGSIETLSFGGMLTFHLAGTFFNCIFAAAMLLLLGYAKKIEAPPWLAGIPAPLRPLAAAITVPLVAWMIWPVRMVLGVLRRAVLGKQADKVLVFPPGIEGPMSISLSSGLRWCALINLELAAINMLPISPLDGGHAIQAVILRVMGNEAATFYGSVGWLVAVALMIAANARAPKRL